MCIRDSTTTVDAFDLSFLVAAPTDGGSFRVVSGGTGCDDYAIDLIGLVSVPSTGGWDVYDDLLMCVFFAFVHRLRTSPVQPLQPTDLNH